MLRWLGMGFLKHQQYVTSSFRECNKKDRGGFGIQGKSSWLPKGSLKLKLIFSGESFHCWNPQIILKKPPFLGFMIHVSFLGCIFYSDAVFFLNLRLSTSWEFWMKPFNKNGRLIYSANRFVGSTSGHCWHLHRDISGSKIPPTLTLKIRWVFPRSPRWKYMYIYLD